MKSKFEYVYTSNLIIGNYDKEKYHSFSSEEKETLKRSLSLCIKNKDKNNKLFSLILGIIVGILAIVFTVLMVIGIINLGDSQWFFYIFFLLGFVLCWLILYHLFGFIFYSRLSILVHFKNIRSNKCDNYAISNYAKWVNQFQKYLGITNFVNGNEMVSFGLKIPSIKNGIIFNQIIYTNIPYFYMGYKKKKIIFLPYFTLVIDGNDSTVYENSKISFVADGKNIQLLGEDTTILEFTCNGEFNNNFFYFKHEQN